MDSVSGCSNLEFEEAEDEVNEDDECYEGEEENDFNREQYCY